MGRKRIQTMKNQQKFCVGNKVWARTSGCSEWIKCEVIEYLRDEFIVPKYALRSIGESDGELTFEVILLDSSQIKSIHSVIPIIMNRIYYPIIRCFSKFYHRFLYI